MSAWIGLGSNLGDGRSEIDRAVSHLEEHPDLTLLRLSSIWRTEPWGNRDQPDFYNAVAEFETRLAPMALLQVLITSEAELGRKRDGERWGPRRIDLDLLLMDKAVLCIPGLELPHPRMHLRAFVLAPLAELEPSLAIPGKGTVLSVLEKLDEQRIERLHAND